MVWVALRQGQQLGCTHVRVPMQQQGTTDGQLGLRGGIKFLKAGQGGVGMAAFCQCLRQGLTLFGLRCLRPRGLAGVNHQLQRAGPACIPTGQVQGALMVGQRFGAIPSRQGQCCWMGGLLLEQLLMKRRVVVAKRQPCPGGTRCFGKAIQQELPGLRGFRRLPMGVVGEGCPFEHHGRHRITPPALAMEQVRCPIPGHHQQGGFATGLWIDGPAVVLPEACLRDLRREALMLPLQQVLPAPCSQPTETSNRKQ